jgi:hypothetical protein
MKIKLNEEQSKKFVEMLLPELIRIQRERENKAATEAKKEKERTSEDKS